MKIKLDGLDKPEDVLDEVSRGDTYESYLIVHIYQKFFSIKSELQNVKGYLIFRWWEDNLLRATVMVSNSGHLHGTEPLANYEFKFFSEMGAKTSDTILKLQDEINRLCERLQSKDERIRTIQKKSLARRRALRSLNVGINRFYKMRSVGDQGPYLSIPIKDYDAMREKLTLIEAKLDSVSFKLTSINTDDHLTCATLFDRLKKELNTL